MTREASVIRTLVEMADSLVDDFDVVELLTALAARCVELLEVSTVGVMLATARGDLRLVASSSEATRVLEIFELQAEEGPCLDAFRSGERVSQPLRERQGEGHWPRFTSEALRAGFRSVTAVPLRLNDDTIGALNLFSVADRPIGESDMLVAQAFADLATIGIVQHRAVRERQRVNEQLSDALRSRVVIEQAKGVIAERAGIDISEAFERLRRFARLQGGRLTDVAEATVEGTLDPSAWAPTG